MKKAIAVIFALITGISILTNIAEAADIKQIILKDGVNVIPSFTPDGRTGTIIKSWRDNGNAWGYHLYLVTAPIVGQYPEGAAGTIGVENQASKKFNDIITDKPHTGDDAIISVAFGISTSNGKKETLLFVAIRKFNGDGVTTSLPTVIDTYHLVSSDGSFGTTIDYFSFLKEDKVGNFCSSDVALAKYTKFPISPDYSGPATKDGCPQ